MTIAQIYEEAKRKLDKNEITIGEFSKIVDREYKEPCEDCISRQAALDEAYTYGYGLELEGYCVDVEDILALPPATPKRKVGEWIKKNNDYFDWYECSECGYGSEGEMKYNRLYDVRTKFCPDCGSQNLKGE